MTAQAHITHYLDTLLTTRQGVQSFMVGAVRVRAETNARHDEVAHGTRRAGELRREVLGGLPPLHRRRNGRRAQHLRVSGQACEGYRCRSVNSLTRARPILTYERKACTKKGVKAAKHGIVYTEGKKPQVLPKEPDLGFAPVRMRMNSDVRDEKLAPESRINYSKLVTVEHNVKVFFIGHIIGEDIMLVSDAVDSCWSHKKRSRPKGR